MGLGATNVRYLYDEDGINLTLQAAAQCISESVNRLSVDGVRLKDPSTGEAVTGWLIGTSVPNYVGIGLPVFFKTCKHKHPHDNLSSLGGPFLWICSQLQRRLEVPCSLVQHDPQCPTWRGDGLQKQAGSLHRHRSPSVVKCALFFKCIDL